MKRLGWLDPRVILPELHAALGAGVLSFFYEFLPHAWFGIALCVFEETIWVKEVRLDPVREPDQPFFWEGAKDLLFYHVGFAFFALVYALHLFL